MGEKEGKFDLIIIGGSAGSLPVIENILTSLPSTFEIPIIIIIHRLRNVLSEMDKLLSIGTGNKKVIEPEDKTPLKPNYIYLAPQNYHLLIEEDKTLSLDYSEQVNFSRPSIDVSFESAAKVYKNRLLAILLSGANKDGASGIQQVLNHEGTAVVQEPETAEYEKMPMEAINKNKSVKIRTPQEIVDCLLSLITPNTFE